MEHQQVVTVMTQITIVPMANQLLTLLNHLRKMGHLIHSTQKEHLHSISIIVMLIIKDIIGHGHGHVYLRHHQPLKNNTTNISIVEIYHMIVIQVVVKHGDKNHDLVMIDIQDIIEREVEVMNVVELINVVDIVVIIVHVHEIDVVVQGDVVIMVVLAAGVVVDVTDVVRLGRPESWSTIKSCDVACKNNCIFYLVLSFFFC